ncbi:MAG: hypothetical protein EOO73_01330 [Myxococcales bacterium]|nr:MAG: hypothetical protein EOO73_01330 [Myxococcales bacterium]
MKIRSIRRRAAVLASLPPLALALACGVGEHPHEVQPLDTSDDFGPSGGVPVAGSTSVGGAGVVGTGGAGGTIPAGTSGGAGASMGGSMQAGGGGGGGGAPALSGVTIQLGSATVPKERAIAFIHLGHSNMAGYGVSPASSAPYHFQDTNPRAFEYHAGNPPALALEPTARTTTQRLAGPGVSLLKEALAVAGPDYYFISLGYGQNSAYCSQFLPGSLYYDELIAASKAIKGRVTFGGIFMYLGITERHGAASDVNGFPNCVNALVTAIRNDVGEPNLPLLMNDYEVEGSGEFAADGAVATAIRPQIAKVPMTVASSALVSCQGLGMQDDHHFNLDGQRTWAQRAIMTMQQKGWFPWK